MTASVIVSIVVVIGVLCWAAGVAVLLSRALSRSLEHADKIHIRAQDHLDTVLDRLMAVDFETLKMHHSADEAEEGGFEGPDEEEGGQEGPTGALGRWGTLSPIEDGEAEDEGENLIREDLAE